MGVTIRIHQDTGGGTGGAVDSFNGRTGFVVSQSGDYTTAQVMQTPDKNYVTDAEKLAIANTSGTNTGDETPLSVKTKYESNVNTNAFTDAEKTKVTNLSGINSGDETTLSIQTKRPLKTVNSQSLEGVGNVVISGPALTKVSSYSSAVINNFNTNTLTDVPNMQLTIASNGNYSFVSTINCSNDKDEEVEVTLAITPISSRNITLIDGTAQALTAGVQFSFVKQLQFDTQKKKQDQTLQRDFIIDGLLVGDEIDVQLNTRGDNVDIDNRWLTGFSVS
ncbi:unnamed protein product [marine sediment metagenome]|uniref:Uncharacterized protein n=1 Tax=marine sediment metagenome TaxID=412755 RepID=X1TIG3_9ZZZZ